MSPEAFCYWLNGYCELDGAHPTPEQWKSIQEHLKLVFNKVTPEVNKEPKPLSTEDVKEIIRNHVTLKEQYYDHKNNKFFTIPPVICDTKLIC